MITELEIVPHTVTPGAKIQVQQFKVVNAHLHQVLLTASRLINATAEMDAGNSGAGMSQNEAQSILSDWERLNAEWVRAVKWKGLAPTGGLENTGTVLLMTPNQMLSLGNVRAQRALQALRGLCERIISSDSAKQEYDIQPADQQTIEQHIGYCAEVLADYIGKVEGGEFTRGINVAAHTHLGTVVPPESMGEASTFEPSVQSPNGMPVPDVADTPSTVPPQQ